MLIPLILLYALYVQFHGDYGAGGGFQAGVIFATGFVLYDLVFGEGNARLVVPPRWLHRLAALGVLIYGGVGVVSLLGGKAFLDYSVLSHDPVHGQHLGVLLVEFGVGHHGVLGHPGDLLRVLGPEPCPMSGLPGLYNDFAAIFLMMAGFYVVISQGNLVKKLVGLGLFQTSVFIFYISMGKVADGNAPILTEGVDALLQPAAACPDPHRHRRRRGHHGGGAGAGGAHPGGLRERGGGGDPGPGRRRGVARGQRTGRRPGQWQGHRVRRPRGHPVLSLLDHLPVLIVIVPLMAAPLCVLVDRPRLAWRVALIAAFASLFCAIALLGQVLDGSVISYELGGWAPPWGIEYRIDLLGAFVLLIVSAMAAVVLTSPRRASSRRSPDRIARFYAAFLLALAGLLGIVATGDAFNVFVFLEISSLASYALISMGRDRRALNAAFQYLVMGTIGATFILIGIGFLYMMTGTLNMQDLAERLPAVADTNTVRAGFAFLTVGIGLKLAMFPLHLWLPNAYAYAPSVVSAFLAATATKVALYVMLRFMLGIFGVDFSLHEMPFDKILLVLGVLGILSGSLVAIYQDNVKRMLAYSSVAQIGYMVLGIAIATTAGVTAAVLHMFNHALMKGVLFLALGAVVYRLGSVTASGPLRPR
jgi:multicomponent Na+:H+ antiporter subunit D